MVRRKTFHALLLAVGLSALASCGDSTAPKKIAVARVDLLPSSVTLQLNETAQLTASVLDANGVVLTERAITWSSTNSSVVAVAGNGLITGLSPGGPVTISATSEGRVGSASVVVLAPVASITLDQTAVVTVPGASTTLVATLKDGAGTSLTRQIQWSTSNANVATVSTTGVVIAVSIGTVAITASSEGKSTATVVDVKEGAIIGANGGNITGLGGLATIVVPPGAVAGNVVFTLESSANSPPDVRVVPGTSVQLGPAGTTFAVPVTLRLRYDPIRVPVGPPERLLGIQRAVFPGWQSVGPSVVDEIGKTVSIALTSFSTYAVLTPAFVNSVTLSESAVTLTLGSPLTLVATPRDASDAALLNRDVQWSSSNPAVATVGQITGAVVTLSVGTTIITAVVEGKSASATITVTPRPAIGLSSTQFTFSATANSANPASQLGTIFNSGGGILTGLSLGTIVYGTGASGWLQTPALNSTTANPSATFLLQPVTGALAPGTYSATITVLSSVASNSPQTISIQFTIASAPAIALSASQLAFTASQGGASPASQLTIITNSGGGVLTGLSLGPIVYGAGASGWLLAPSLSSTSANPSSTFLLQAITGALAQGTYSATLTVASAVATNSPQTITISFTITAPPVGPMIALSQSTLTFSALVGGANPASRAITITNGGTGTLTSLGTGVITYGSGASNWLQAPAFSSTTANPSATLTIQPQTGSLATGTYTATIPVLSGVAANSPRDVTITFNVTDNACSTSSAISVGQTVAGSIATSDCILNTAPGRYADIYVLTLAAPTNISVTMTSTIPNVLDTYIILVNATTGATIAEDDDSGPATDSQLLRSLPAGTYFIQAGGYDLAELGAYTLSVQTASAAASVAISAGNAQIAPPNSNVPIAPSVIVRDGNNIPVAGVSVTFSIVGSIGSVTGAVALSNSSGIATVGSWTLASGANVLAATVSGVGVSGNPAVFSATGRASSAGFNVDLRFLTMPTLSQLETFRTAVSRWESIITGDLPSYALNTFPGECTSNSPAMNEQVDDLLILVTLEPIDGSGSILGSAGPCEIRGSNSLPVLGTMRFDVADIANMEATGRFNDVILHEMGHVLGIGTLWNQPAFDFLKLPSLPSSPGVDTHYSGASGVAGFNLIGGNTYTGGQKVPVENTQGGGGTRDAHWRENVLANELMTGFISGTTRPLSALTVGSLQDFNYTVNMAAADPFFLTLSARLDEGAKEKPLHLLNDVRTGPIKRIDPMGRVIGVIRR